MRQHDVAKERKLFKHNRISTIQKGTKPSARTIFEGFNPLVNNACDIRFNLHPCHFWSGWALYWHVVLYRHCMKHTEDLRPRYKINTGMDMQHREHCNTMDQIKSYWCTPQVASADSVSANHTKQPRKRKTIVAMALMHVLFPLWAPALTWTPHQRSLRFNAFIKLFLPLLDKKPGSMTKLW